MNTSTTAAANASSSQKAAGILVLLGLFAGLCTLFALVVTVGEAWRDHVQQTWPQATARIQACSVEDYHRYRASKRRHSYYIRCRITYEPGNEEIPTRIESRTTFNENDIASMNDWVNSYEPGSGLAIHYDPANHQKAVLTETDMPYAGPNTTNNLRVLRAAALSCVLLLAISRILLRRSTSSKNAIAAEP